MCLLLSVLFCCGITDENASPFFQYGDNGLKSDFGGHDNYWHGNVLAYVGNCYTVFSFKG